MSNTGGFMFQLESLGYFLDKNLNVWKREDYTNIGYNDGDAAENHLAKIIRNAHDISLFSSELRDQCSDWQTLYHLSSQRGNVLRPFAHLLRGDVLEIGAGCGAISRFLGENGGNILALEGSQRRASIAASRTRDLKNVQVVAERFDCFKPDRQFDAITLIGVLEYATMFGDGDHPEKDLLIQIRKLLKPGGFLFIAIENKLGLKYFAGAPEDHIRQSMYGIEGRYKSGEPKTWGYEELTNLLTQTGYNNSDVMLPFPDYKLPMSIITPKGSNSTVFDASALAVQSVFSDPQLPTHLTFSLAKCFPEIFNNKLGVSLANSFIFVASVDGDVLIDDSVLAYHYSTQRKKEYSKETIFRENENGEINISYQFFQKDFVESDNIKYTQIRRNNDHYYKGVLLGQKFINTLSTDNWDFNNFIGLMKEWLYALNSFIQKSNSVVQPLVIETNYLLPGSFIDAIPQNIIIQDEGPVLFDLEWQHSDGIELGHLLFRGIILVLNQAQVRSPTGNELITRKEFIKYVFENLGMHLSDKDLHNYMQREAEFQHQVTGRSVGELLNWNGEKNLSPVNIKQNIACIYYASQETEFTEDKKQYSVLSSGRNIIRWKIKNDIQSPQIKLRFDPVDSRIWFILHTFIIKNADGEVVWQLRNEHDYAEYIDILTIKNSEFNQIYYSISDDPQILLKQLPLLPEIIIEAEIEIIKNDSLITIFQNNEKHEMETIREQLNATTEKLITTTAQFETAMAQLDVITAQLENSKAQLSTTKAQLEHTNNQFTGAMSRVNALESSSSWRITAPLRRIGMVKRRCKILTSLTRRLYSQHGLKKIVSRGMQTLRDEGVKGVIARLRHQRIIQMMHTSANLNTPVQPIPANSAESNISSGIQQVSGMLNSSITYNRSEGYSLKSGRAEYCYVTPAQPEDLNHIIAEMVVKPLFSIVVPIYNTPLDLLQELIESIEAQWYPKWELILANDCSTDPELYDALENIINPQIKIVHLKTNSRISGATNVAIENASGDYIVFTDHDDLLTPDCLYEMALCINNEDPDFIYSDEDKISEEGCYVQPHFKPDWSPDTMMSTMFTCHASCVKVSLLEKTGLLRSAFDGCQDWDFVLRVAEQTTKISHIAKVLYHWRIIPQSIASDISAKDYVLEASKKVREEALVRRGQSGCVESVSGYPGYFRVNYFPVGDPLVSIIIPTRDNYHVLHRCIESIKNITRYNHYEIIILDNGSVAADTLEYFSSLSKDNVVKIIRHDHPFNFSELNNVGVAQSHGDVLLFLNDDTEAIHADWLERMVGYAQLPHVGAVGAKLLYPQTNRIQHAGVLNLADGPGHAFINTERHHPGYYMRNILEYNWLAVTGACLMMERTKFERIGQFDETFPIAYNDVELCFRSVDAGYFNVVCQGVELYHHESVSRGVDHLDEEKVRRLLTEKRRLNEKHPLYYQYDPFYNINLHPNGINFEIGC